MRLQANIRKATLLLSSPTFVGSARHPLLGRELSVQLCWLEQVLLLCCAWFGSLDPLVDEVSHISMRLHLCRNRFWLAAGTKNTGRLHACR